MKSKDLNCLFLNVDYKDGLFLNIPNFLNLLILNFRKKQ
jgi:hypothetical protein